MSKYEVSMLTQRYRSNRRVTVQFLFIVTMLSHTVITIAVSTIKYELVTVVRTVRVDSYSPINEAKIILIRDDIFEARFYFQQRRSPWLGRNGTSREFVTKSFVAERGLRD